MWQRAAGQRKHLQYVVKNRRVAAVLIDDRQNLFYLRPEQRRLEHLFSSDCPIDIASQCIDLAIMGDIAIRVRSGPARECISAEPRMNEGKRGFHRAVRQVRVEYGQLRRCQHSLVHNRLARQTRNVEHRPVLDNRILDRALNPLADYIQPPLEGLILCFSDSPDQYLLYNWLRAAGGWPYG